MAFETPGTPKQEKKEVKSLLDKLKKIKGQLKELGNRSKEVEIINEKIEALQAEMQTSAEPRNASSMTEDEYQQKIKESESVKSSKENFLNEDKKQTPTDVRERAKIVRKKLGEEVDEETAQKLLGALSKEEKKEFEERHESTKKSETTEQEIPRSFVDVFSEKILESLSGEEKELVNKYKGFFQKLNEAPENKRPGIVSQHARDGDMEYNEANQIRQIVDRLKEENS